MRGQRHRVGIFVAAALALPMAAIAVTPAAAQPLDTTTLSIPGQDAPPLPDAVANIDRCLADSDQPRLMALVVLDESGSIGHSDSEDERVPGVRALLRSLNDLAERDTGRDVDVQVRIATFAATYEAFDDGWRSLDSAGTSALDDAAGQLADREHGAATNHLAALEGARADMAERSAELTDGGSPPPCKLLVFFTDGAFDLDREPLTDSADERTARDALCRPDGVVDQLRADGVVTIGVGLRAPDGTDFLPFLEAVTRGSGAGGEACGTSGSSDTGLIVSTGDDNDLFFLLAGLGSGQADISCPEEINPDCTLDIPEGFDGFSLLVQASDANVVVHITEPGSDDPYEVVPAQDVPIDRSAFAHASLRADSLGPQETRIDIDAREPDDVAGRWTVQIVSPSEPISGRIEVRLKGALVPVVVGDRVVRRGTTTELELGFTSRDGEAIELPSELADATITATLREPGTTSANDASEPLDVTDTGDGTFSVEVPVDEGAEAETLQLELATQVDTESDDITAEVRNYALDILPPPGYPTIEPRQLGLPTLWGDGDSSGELTIVGAPDGRGCAWFEPAEVTYPPAGDADERRPLPIEVTSEGGSRGSGPDDCIEVGPSERIPLTVTADADSSGDGQANGGLAFHLTSEARSGEETQTVGVELAMRPEPCSWCVRVTFALLFSLGIGLQLLVLALAARWAVVRSEDGVLRRCHIHGVTVTGGDVLVDGRPLECPPGDEFGPVFTRLRLFSLRLPLGEQLTARYRLGDRWRRRARRLFSGLEAVVIDDRGRPLVVGAPGLDESSLRSYPAERAHQLPSSLGPAWVFRPEGVTPDLDGPDDDGVGDDDYGSYRDYGDEGAGSGSLTLLLPGTADLQARASLLVDHVREHLPRGFVDRAPEPPETFTTV
jgi:hypothetical protein